MKQLQSLFAITALSGLMWTSSAGGPAPSPAPSPPIVPMGWTSGSTGADGNLDFGDPGSLPPGITETSANNFLVDLAMFPGNYDPVRWAMVFHYVNITVPAGITVSFANHASRAPVAWLATGDVTIGGAVTLTGNTAHWEGTTDRSWAEPGPGGFRGGRGGYLGNGDNSAGFGPGGGVAYPGCDLGGPGAYATDGGLGSPTYGSVGVMPLIGGSGGGAAAGWSSGGGGAGGGAILVAADGLVRVTGSILADSGGGGNGVWTGSSCTTNAGARGSGGAIRLVAHRVELDSATLQAVSAPAGNGVVGGDGRIRIETNGALNFVQDNGVIAPAADIQWTRSEVFPSQQPSLTVISIDDGLTVTPTDLTDPGAHFQPAGLADVQIESPSLVTLNVEATNIAPGWLVHARVAHTRGEGAWYPATDVGVPLVGDMTLSTCSIPNVDLAGGVSAIQLRAWNPNP